MRGSSALLRGAAGLPPGKRLTKEIRLSSIGGSAIGLNSHSLDSPVRTNGNGAIPCRWHRPGRRRDRQAKAAFYLRLSRPRLSRSVGIGRIESRRRSLRLRPRPGAGSGARSAISSTSATSSRVLGRACAGISTVAAGLTCAIVILLDQLAEPLDRSAPFEGVDAAGDRRHRRPAGPRRSRRPPRPDRAAHAPPSTDTAAHGPGRRCRPPRCRRAAGRRLRAAPCAPPIPLLRAPPCNLRASSAARATSSADSALFCFIDCSLRARVSRSLTASPGRAWI